nr:MAG TPA: hypothetical protein [Caudoviricetes sp.]
MAKKHAPTIYRCATRLDATDCANLYYIAAPVLSVIMWTVRAMPIVLKL